MVVEEPERAPSPGKDIPVVLPNREFLLLVHIFIVESSFEYEYDFMPRLTLKREDVLQGAEKHEIEYLAAKLLPHLALDGFESGLTGLHTTT